VLHLRVLGRLDLRDDDGREPHAVLAQPKRLALLAYLAARAAGSYCGRDTLLALFWPEADTERARTALRGALHFLRRELGAEVVRTRGDEVGLDPARLDCDAARFEEAVADGRLDDALALYGGDLLDGVHVAEAPDFERWRDDERARLRRLALDAMQALGARREAAGDLAGAIRAARRGGDLAPEDEALTQRLLTLLDRTGDRAGALRAYDDFATRLRTAYETDPSPETRALVDAIRRRASPSPPAQAPAGQPAIAPAIVWGAVVGAAPPARPAPRRSRTLAAAGALLVVALGIGAAWRGRVRGAAAASATSSPDVVAVLPFAYEGGPALAYLGDGVARLLTTNLGGAGALRVADPVAVRRATGGGAVVDADAAHALAVRLGAGLVVRGQVVEAGGRVRVSADLLGRDGRPASQIAVDGTSDRLFDLVDDLTARVVAAWGVERGQRLTSLAARTTHSLPALRAYLDGEREYAAGRYGAAVDAYQRAVAADSTFALAYYRLSSALTWTSSPLTVAATRGALRFVDRLSHRDSALVVARHANSTGEPEVAERLYRQVLADYPDELEAWYQLAEVQYHWAALLGRPAAESEAAFARTLALDPSNVPALVHLARLAAADGRTARLDSLRARLAPLAVGTEEALELDALDALVTRPPSVDAIAPRIAAIAGIAATRAVRLVPALAASTGNPAAALAVVRTLAARAAPSAPPIGALEAQLELATGRWHAAAAALDRVAESSSVAADQYRAAFIGALVAFAPAPPPAAVLAAARAAVERAPVAPPPPLRAASILDVSDDRAQGGMFAARRAYLLARLAALSGDTAAAFRAAHATLAGDAAEGGALASRIVRYARGAAALHAGHPADGLRALGPAAFPLARALPGLASFATADERFLRAELLRAAGRDEEALAWYATFPDPSGYDLVYLAPARLGQARILDRLGRRAEAVAHYRRVVALWSECDPELRPLVDEARRRLAALGG